MSRHLLSPYMTITSLYVPRYAHMFTWGLDIRLLLGQSHILSPRHLIIVCNISRHLIILAVTSHGISSFGCHISRHLINWLAFTSHGLSSFGCHISRHLINWLSHLTECHQLAGCHTISHHCQLSYLKASHHLAVISPGISSTGCHISRHLRFHDISWGKICCSNSSLLELPRRPGFDPNRDSLGTSSRGWRWPWSVFLWYQLENFTVQVNATVYYDY